MTHKDLSAFNFKNLSPFREFLKFSLKKLNFKRKGIICNSDLIKIERTYCYEFHIDLKTNESIDYKLDFCNRIIESFISLKAQLLNTSPVLVKKTH